MADAAKLQDLARRLNAIADEVTENSKWETDELSAHLWILRSVTIRDYAESVASLYARATREPSQSGESTSSAAFK